MTPSTIPLTVTHPNSVRTYLSTCYHGQENSLRYHVSILSNSSFIPSKQRPIYDLYLFIFFFASKLKITGWLVTFLELLKVMRQLFAPECATWLCMDWTVHSYANRLACCTRPQVKREGLRQFHCNFHYTLLEHIYQYVSSQFKLPPEHQPCECNLLVQLVWIL